MVSKTLTKIAEKENYPILGDVVRCTRFSEPVGFSLLVQGGRQHSVSVPVKPDSWSKELQKALKKELKSFGALSYNKNNSTVSLAMAVSMKAEKAQQSLEEGADALMDALRKNGVQYRDTCMFCGRDGCDDYAGEAAVCVPAHAGCKAQQAQKIMDQVTDNEVNGNVLFAVLAAFAGGLVGAVPSFITIYFFDYIIGWLFALIPLGAYTGYKIAKGIMNGAVPFIISLISLIDTVVLVLISLYVLVMEYVKAELAYVGLDSLYSNSELSKLTWEAIFSDDMRGELVVACLQPLLFCIIGIAIAWSWIKKSNKDLRRQAQALAASSAVVDD